MRFSPYKIVTLILIILVSISRVTAYAQTNTESKNEISYISKLITTKTEIKVQDSKQDVIKVEEVKVNIAPLKPNNCSAYNDLITAASQKYNVRKELLIAQLFKESGCNPNAISKTGDYGICQIHLAAHPDVTAAQALNPEFCINFQASAMSRLINTFGDEYNALRGYNCGTAGARNNINCGASYARDILANAGIY